MVDRDFDFRTSMRLVIRDVAAKAADGLTLREAGQIAIEFLQLAIQAAAKLALPGSLKKEAVLGAFEELLDVLLPLLPLPWFLAPFRKIILAKAKVILMALADGAIEAIYRWWKQRQPVPQTDS